MSAPDHRPEPIAADLLYFTLIQAHSPYAAVLMAAAAMASRDDAGATPSERSR